MIPATPKSVFAINAASTTNAATASGYVDTRGFSFARVSVELPTSNAVTNNPSVLKLQASDTTAATSFADITGFRGDTDFTIPNCITAATSITGPFAVMELCPPKRYLQVVCSPLTTQVITARIDLLLPAELPNSATEANALVLVQA